MEVLLGALAEAIIALLLEDVTQRPWLAALRDQVRGAAPEKVALQHALAQSYRALAEQYPHLTAAFLDEPFLQKQAVVAELAKLLTPDQTPNAPTLLRLWQVQFATLPAADISPALGFFLATLTRAVKGQPALKPFTDSRALDQLYAIAEQGGAQVDQQRVTNQQLSKIRQLLTEVATLLATERHSIHIQTGGGGVVLGDIHTGGGDFVGHDQTTATAHTAPQPGPTRQPAPNPFTDRGRINDPSRFYVRQPLDEMSRDYQQAFYASYINLPVSYLSPADAEQLITRPTPDFTLNYHATVVADIYRHTHGQPLLLQAICSALVNHVNHQLFDQEMEREARVLPADLEAVLTDDFLRQESRYFDGIWRDQIAAFPDQQAILRTLAQQATPLSAGELARHTRFSLEQVTTALQALTKRDVVTEEEGQWRLLMPLFARWLRLGGRGLT